VFKKGTLGDLRDQVAALYLYKIIQKAHMKENYNKNYKYDNSC